MRALITGVLAAAILFVGTGVGAAEIFPVYTGDEFDELFSEAPLDVTDEVGIAGILGIPALDARIRSLAEDRGYRPRPQAAGDLVRVEGGWLHPEAAAAWAALHAAATEAGVPMRIVSAHRTHEQQRRLFLSKLSSHSDASIERRLAWSAPPGYSKHHTGYAVDLAVAGSEHQNFGRSDAYRWLSADNYLNAKRFGFIPSYPPDASRSGPNPEPWEWLYVGPDLIRCRGDLTCGLLVHGQGHGVAGVIPL